MGPTIALSSGDYVFYTGQTGEKSIYKILSVKLPNAMVQKVNFDGGLAKSKFDTPVRKLTRIWLQPGDKVYNQKNRKVGSMTGYMTSEVSAAGANKTPKRYINHFTVYYPDGQQEWLTMDESIRVLEPMEADTAAL